MHRREETTETHVRDEEEQTVLLAEDVDDLRRFVTRVLTQAGLKVIAATNGADAIQKAQEHTGKIDLLLSDIDMPKMTGFELAEQINTMRPDTKIMLMSGLHSGTLLVDHGWHFLSKPFTPDSLKQRIRALLKYSSDEAPPA
jgi:CheY-like chemotaxis protein